jgi:hypothetical protein
MHLYTTFLLASVCGMCLTTPEGGIGNLEQRDPGVVRSYGGLEIYEGLELSTLTLLFE